MYRKNSTHLQTINATNNQIHTHTDVDLADVKLPVCPRPSSIPNLKLNKGTTTLAFEFQGGILVAVDSRASSGTYVGMSKGAFVLSLVAYLIIPSIQNRKYMK